jgi:TIR domain
MSDATAPAKPTIFISYSRKDSKWRDFVQGHLAPATTHGHFETWDDRRIDAGVDWKAEIDAALWKCVAFILLVSRYSLASRFILDEEVKAALEAHWTRGVQIYPIVVTACDIQAVPWLARMNLRPRDAKPLALYPPARRDEVMATLAAEIRRIIENASAPNALAP